MDARDVNTGREEADSMAQSADKRFSGPDQPEGAGAFRHVMDTVNLRAVQMPPHRHHGGAQRRASLLRIPQDGAQHALAGKAQQHRRPAT